MGIKNLNTLILEYASEAINKKHLSSYSGKTIAIDASIYIYKYLYGESNHINGIFFQVNKFFKYNITPIYIFDGKPPAEKELTLINRSNNKTKLKQKITNIQYKLATINNNNKISIEDKKLLETKLLQDIKNLNKKLIYVTSEIIQKTKNLLDLMGVKYIDAPCEAEHYCSMLVKNNILDGVLSEDMDTIACGSQIILRKFSNKEDFIYEYDLNKILKLFNLNINELRDICILCGNDYINRLRGMDQYIAYNLIKKYSNIETLIINKHIRVPDRYDYKTSRKIYRLDGINMSKEDIITIREQKDPDINELKSFLKNNSSIDEKIYNHRISMMFNIESNIYSQSKIEFKLNCTKSSYFNKLKQNINVHEFVL